MEEWTGERGRNLRKAGLTMSDAVAKDWANGPLIFAGKLKGHLMKARAADREQ